MIDPPRPIPESYWVVPDRFLAGEYPGRYEFEQTTRRLDAFLEAGFDAFFDLTQPNELPPYLSVLKEQAKVYDRQIEYTRFPIDDLGLPARVDMKATLDAIDAALGRARKVYLHCWGGVGRTGTVVGCYLVRHGKTGRQALAQLGRWWQQVPKSHLHPRSPEVEAQVKFILDWKE